MLDLIEEKKVLKRYRCKIKFKMDKTTKVFTKIRWLRPEEKVYAKRNDKINMV